MLKLLESKIFFFLTTTIIILSLNLTPLVLQYSHSPPGRTFALIHNNTQDFFFYQSLMNQGAEGSLLTRDSYTSEPHHSSIIFSYFLWFGKISNLLNIPYPIMYHLIRILFAILFLLSAYFLLFAFSVPHPRLTYFLFLFAAPLMHQIEDGGTTREVEYMYWWTGMDPIRRAAYLPHHAIGAFLLVLSMILIVRFIKKPQRKYIIWLSIFAIILAFIHTPSLFILLITLPGALFIYNLNFIKNFKFQISNYFPLLVYWFIGLLALLFMVSQTQKGFPWSQYIEWEKSLQFPLDKELIGAFGFLFPFSLVGIVKALKTKEFPFILVATWFIFPLFLIPFSPMLNISNIRLIQGIPYLPLAILGVLGMKTIGNLLLKTPLPFFSRLKNWHIISIWYGIFTILFIIFTFPTLIWSIKDQIREFWAIYGNVYFDNRLIEAFSFMNQKLPQNTVTVATFYAGNYIPAFTNTTSFIGHSGYTYNLSQKEPLVKRFFEGNMSDQETREFISSNNIDVVFQGPEEMILFGRELYPNVLRPIFNNGVVILYKMI
ncbi:hypothetical protein HYW54_04040 [Candidatus Gottesmanbacteria bacterium]|nr:hypothetical protein [Candidatus Gottesmanbacteria bacterium]